jgi:hypothetical protein
MKQHSNWIRTRLAQLDIKQKDLIARLESRGHGYSQSTISGWMSGEYQPPLNDPEFAEVLAAALRMTVKDMLVLAGYQIKDNGHTDEGRQAAYIVDQLPADRRKLAIGILEQLLDTKKEAELG